MKNYGFIFLLLIGFTTAFYGQKTTLTPAFEVTVTGEGNPLFLIPGATCSGAVWDATVEQYSKQYECHVFTLAGYAGVMPLDTTPILSAIQSALKDYIETHKGKKNYIMGHSIGGFLALQLAIESPSFFDKIVIVDALPFYYGLANPKATAKDVKVSGEQMLAMYQNLDSIAFVKNQEMVLNIMIRGEADKKKALQWSLASDRKTMAYTMAEMMQTDLRETIAAIQSPTLVLAAWDAESMGWFAKKENLLDSYQKQYENQPNCTVVMAEKARHFIMFDDADWFFKTVGNFLK